MTVSTTAVSDNVLESIQWTPQPKAGALIRDLTDGFLADCDFAAQLRDRLRDEAGVRIIDLIDHIELRKAIGVEKSLTEAGYVRRPLRGAPECYVHEQGLFPAIVLDPDIGMERVFLKVESVADFASVWQIPSWRNRIHGEPLSALRKMRADQEVFDGELWVIERHGDEGFDVPAFDSRAGVAALRHLEAFRRRPRDVQEAEGFQAAHRLIDAAIAEVGVDRACDLFFSAEREYWQRRNRAGQVQKARQDRLGIGWANHDHHTYRSTREHFAPMMAIFAKLGFVPRERFYAGLQAGWGAQIVEQPRAKIVIFADVDLSPDELQQDFAREGLPPRKELGTVGLWCALHGEAFLQAGMHHLECQFDFDGLREQLETKEGVKVMKPFTNFPYLRQAFTEAEIWPVRGERIDALLSAGRITEAQAQQFHEHGALGSHLENLERNEGFKGFNQTGISDIIHRTDPRRQSKH